MRLSGFAVGAVVLGATLPGQAADKIFDPSRDPVRDLQAAEVRAGAEHKNILLDVGGNWCPWCILLDRTLNTDANLHALLERNYVVIHVNFSTEDQNAVFLSQYPKANGYPAWYVLSPGGKLLKAEDTSELEETHKLNEGYRREALENFLTRNAPR